jgi:hypothetical protein
MTTYLLFNKETPGEGRMQQLAKELKAVLVESELVDADSPRGVDLAEHYEIVGRPAVLVVRDDGSPVQVWQDAEQLPNPGEISYLTHQ